MCVPLRACMNVGADDSVVTRHRRPAVIADERKCNNTSFSFSTRTVSAIKALPWFTSVRRTLEDPAYAPWFLRFNCSNASRAGAHAAAPHCTLVQNVAYDRGSSGPLPDVPATSAADCCAQCGAYPGCWAAAFPPGQNRCYFKTEVRGIGGGVGGGGGGERAPD